MRPQVLIELFTNGCPSCTGWLAYAQQLAASSDGYELRVCDLREKEEAVEYERRLVQYGVRELPALVVGGELLTCCR